MKAIFLVPLLLLMSCTSMIKPFKGEVTRVRVFDTGKSVAESYDDSLVFFAKYMKDSSSAIKVKERESGTVVVKISSACEVTFVMGNKAPIYLRFVADVKFKENKARLKLEVDPMRDHTGAYGDVSRIPLHNSKDQQANLDKCLDELEADIVKGLKKKTEKW